MTRGIRFKAMRYGAALLAAGAAGLLTFLLGTVVQPVPQLLFLTAVVIGARFGGLGPGLLATLVGALLTYFLLESPEAQLVASDPNRLARLGLFVLLSVLISGIGEKLRQATQTLEESQNLFRSFMDHCPATAFMKDEEGRYVYANEPFRRAFGISNEDWLGRTDQELWPGELSDLYRENDRSVLNTNAPREVLEPFVRDGKRSCWLTLKFPFVDRSGRRLLAGMAIDVSERLRLEQELQERVQELGEADRRKNEFLAMLAHELRNPLAAISNASYVLEEARLPRPRAAHLRGVISHQTQHLIRLVDDLLDIGRITQGKVSLRIRTVELSTITWAAVESVRPLIASRGHELTVRLPPRPLLLQGDPDRLEQVFANLLTNAARYSEPGGRIWLEVGAEGSVFIVRVKDTGVGIAADMLEQIFEPFRQGHNTASQSQGGMGIGLALARNLVLLHGGTLHACSEGTGRGSEFVVSLPCGPDAAPDPEGLASNSPGSGAHNLSVMPPQPESTRRPHLSLPSARPGSRSSRGVSAPILAHARIRRPSPNRVLIVDDNVCAAETLAELVELWGFEVLTRTNGEQALVAAAEWQPQTVLLDLQMPGLDGFEVARRLRGMSFPRHLQLVALTGCGHEVAVRTSEAGFDTHLVKPVDPETLQRLLESN